MNAAEAARPRVDVASDGSDLARRVLACFVSAARETLGQRDCFRVAVSGGRTPRRFFELLGADPEGQALDWNRIHLFWTDERYVPPDSDQSNFRLVAETLLPRIPIPPENVHAIPTNHADLFEAVHAYENTLREVFRVPVGQVPAFDLVLLGMGADGHTASLFPNTYAPFDTEDWVCAVFKLGGEANRVTLTGPVLRAAARLVVVVSGPDKAETLEAVLHEDPDEARYPIHVLWPVLDRVTWLVDRAAAGQLTAD